jgi:hypothetical protein
MYISRLVKTRTPHSGLLIHRHSGSFISLAPHFNISSPSSYLCLSYSHPFLHLNLLFVYLGGSALMPSHIQRGPSVAIPSVRSIIAESSTSCIHIPFVQVGLTLDKVLH